jgi:hypothetical protein
MQILWIGKLKNGDACTGADTRGVPHWSSEDCTIHPANMRLTRTPGPWGIRTGPLPDEEGRHAGIPSRYPPMDTMNYEQRDHNTLLLDFPFILLRAYVLVTSTI